jgi:Protein of unknown function (DUF3143)
MPDLPPPQAPLYNHPLPALESWLRQLGAVQRGVNSCLWDLQTPEWSAELELEIEELSVRWQGAGASVERHFPYGFSRADVEAAILAGP